MNGPLARLHRRGDRRVARHHDDLDRLVVTLDLFEELEAVHVGHADVGDDCVEHVAAERLERLGGARRRCHLIAPLREGFPEEPEDRGLVVNYQDLCRFHRLTDSDFSTTRCQTDKLLVRPLPCAIGGSMLALTLTFY